MTRPSRPAPQIARRSRSHRPPTALAALAAFALAIPSAAVLSSTPARAASAKVSICHRSVDAETDNESDQQDGGDGRDGRLSAPGASVVRYRLITVSTAAVPGHLAHRDAAPGAAVPGQPGSVFTANCQVNALPIVNDQTFTTPENTANGTVIATIAFSDADPGEVPAITVTGGTGSTAFAVSSSGAISVVNSAQLDFETTPSFLLNVRVTDPRGGTDTAVITINLLDVRENPPILANQNFAIDENSANASVVGTIAFSDPDLGDVVTLAVTGGSGATAFAVNPTSGKITVTDSAQLDFEATPSLTLNVTATDLIGLTTSATMTIALNDIVECITNDATLRSAAAHGGAYCVNASAPIVLTGGQVAVGTTLTLTSTGPGNAVIDANLLSRVFSVTGNLTLNNITVTRGRVSGGGGGIRLVTGSVVLNGTSSLTGNAAWYGGGAIVSDTFNSAGSTLTLNDSASVSGNAASPLGANVTTGGGGVYVNQFGTLTMNNASAIANNTVGGGAVSLGAGILINGAVARLNDSAAIAGNTAGPSSFANESLGGGVYFVNGGLLALTGSARIVGNRAADTGGGIYRIDANFGSITGVTAANVTTNAPNNCDGPAAVPGCVG